MAKKINMSIKDKKGAYEFKNSNLRFHGMKMDINGNPCFVLSTPNQRAFSVQQPYSITIHWSTKNGNSKESGVEIVEKNIKGNPFKSEEEFESYVLDLAKGRKHVKVYGNNFACGGKNFSIKEIGVGKYEITFFGKKALYDYLKNYLDTIGERKITSPFYKNIKLEKVDEDEYGWCHIKITCHNYETTEVMKGLLFDAGYSLGKSGKENFSIESKGRKFAWYKQRNQDKTAYTEYDIVCLEKQKNHRGETYYVGMNVLVDNKSNGEYILGEHFEVERPSDLAYHGKKVQADENMLKIERHIGKYDFSILDDIFNGGILMF